MSSPRLPEPNQQAQPASSATNLPEQPRPPEPDTSLPDTYPFNPDGSLCREFLLERGYCCGNGCRNCPYEEE